VSGTETSAAFSPLASPPGKASCGRTWLYMRRLYKISIKIVRQAFLTQVIFKYTAQQKISQSHHYIGIPMSLDETRRQRFGANAIIPTLALLMLLGTGCSEKENTAPEEDAPVHAPAPQIAETAVPPPVKAPEPIAVPEKPKAVTEPNASRSADMTPQAVKAFVPTHTVRANLNLRPSPSLNTTPIAVLKAGSEVEYIKEDEGWYYVNTQLHGKGWCSSKYLTSLSPPKNK
jgi:hypothetical protein